MTTTKTQPLVTPISTQSQQQTQNIINKNLKITNITTKNELLKEIFKGNINKNSYLHPKSKEGYGSYQLHVYKKKTKNVNNYKLITNTFTLNKLIQLHLNLLNLSSEIINYDEKYCV